MRRGRLVAVHNCCHDVLLETHKCSQASVHLPSSAALPALPIRPTLHGPKCLPAHALPFCRLSTAPKCLPACPRGVSALTAARRGRHAPARAVAGRTPFHRPIRAVACRRFWSSFGNVGPNRADARSLGGKR